MQFLTPIDVRELPYIPEPVRTSSDDVAPAVVFSGPVAERAVELTCAGETTPLTVEEGRVKLGLPPGSTAFLVSLR